MKPEEINPYSMSIEELWNFIECHKEELQEEELNDIETIKRGIHIEMPINYIIEGYYEDQPDIKKTSVKGYGKFDISDFWEEIQEKKKAMRKIVERLITIKEPIKPRVT